MHARNLFRAVRSQIANTGRFDFSLSLSLSLRTRFFLTNLKSILSKSIPNTKPINRNRGFIFQHRESLLLFFFPPRGSTFPERRLTFLLEITTNTIPTVSFTHSINNVSRTYGEPYRRGDGRNPLALIILLRRYAASAYQNCSNASRSRPRRVEFEEPFLQSISGIKYGGGEYGDMCLHSFARVYHYAVHSHRLRIQKSYAPRNRSQLCKYRSYARCIRDHVITAYDTR